MKRNAVAMFFLAFFACLFASTAIGAGRVDANASTNRLNSTVLVEFVIVQPLLIETVTCLSWYNHWDGVSGIGTIEGSKCTSTHTVPSRTGTQGGDVAATFDMSNGAPTVNLNSCYMQAVNASGGGGDVVLQFYVDCS